MATDRALRRGRRSCRILGPRVLGPLGSVAVLTGVSLIL
jgi:hypothetical protein